MECEVRALLMYAQYLLELVIEDDSQEFDHAKMQCAAIDMIQRAWWIHSKLQDARPLSAATNELVAILEADYAIENARSAAKGFGK